jgi:hypothetical protein
LFDYEWVKVLHRSLGRTASGCDDGGVGSAGIGWGFGRDFNDSASGSVAWAGSGFGAGAASICHVHVTYKNKIKTMKFASKKKIAYS